MEENRNSDIFVSWHTLPHSLCFSDRDLPVQNALQMVRLLSYLTADSKVKADFNEAITTLWAYLQDLVDIADGTSQLPLAGKVFPEYYPTLKEQLEMPIQPIREAIQFEDAELFLRMEDEAIAQQIQALQEKQAQKTRLKEILKVGETCFKKMSDEERNRLLKEQQERAEQEINQRHSDLFKRVFEMAERHIAGTQNTTNTEDSEQ